MLGKKVFFFIIFFSLIASILCTKNADYSEDLGRHLALGKLIVQTHTIPKTNLFSYTNPSFPFTNHHWLSEVIFYGVHAALGDSGLILLKIFVVGFTLGLLGYMAKKKSSWAAVTFVLGALAFILWSRTSLRPEIFGYALFALVLWIVFFKRSSTRALFLLIPINSIWVNVHITFVFGMALEGILIMFLLYKHLFVEKQNKIHFIVLLFSFASFIVNPSLLSGMLYPFKIFSNYGYTIAENQGIRFMMNYTNWIYYRYVFIFLIIGFITSIYFLFQKKLLEGAILFLFSAATCWQIRHAPFFALSALFLMPQALNSVIKRIRIFFPVTSMLFTVTSIVIGVFSIYLLSSNTYSNMYLQSTEQGFGQKDNYKSSISFVEKSNLPNNIFNNFDIGGYLIYTLYPRYKVFVDNRPEAYPAHFFDIYKNIQVDAKTRKKEFARYGIHTVIFSHTDQTEWAQIFIRNIFQDKTWKLVYLDPYIFVMTDASVLDIRGKLEAQFFEQRISEAKNRQEAVNYFILLSVLQQKELSEIAMSKLVTLAPESCTVQKNKNYQYSLMNTEYYRERSQSIRHSFWYCF
ncbi:MAG: hypothetical protein NUV65_02615 [Candidatus Roizmanbacteria bacterium]|nr:hypothetical protein [Candidatus Roizmanbacteria bacterium]